MTLKRLALLLAFIAIVLGSTALIERAADAEGRAEARAEAAGSGSEITPSPLAGAPLVPTPPDIAHLPVNPPDDPAEIVGQGVQFARTGKGRAAVGTAMVLLVWILRRIAKPKVPWFATKVGGYVLSFGCATILYIGGGLIADITITFNLIFDAFTTALAAGGGWEALLDVLGYAKARGAAASAAAGASIVITAVGCYMIIAFASCTPAKHAGSTVIDCLIAEAKPAIAEAKADLDATFASGPDWAKILAQAEAHGVNAGGCALAELVQNYLAPAPGRMAPPVAAGHDAKNALETFRANTANGATFKTASGDL